MIIYFVLITGIIGENYAITLLGCGIKFQKFQQRNCSKILQKMPFDTIKNEIYAYILLYLVGLTALFFLWFAIFKIIFLKCG